MSWTRRINHPSEVVQKGDEVQAVITSVDSYNQRISLSMKELLPNEWEEYANSHGVGDVDNGSVTNVTDFGVFVELAPGVEGLCHISEIDRDEGLSLAEMFTPGQRVQCRILRVDWHESRIGLSMHGVQQGEISDAGTAGSGETQQPETAMAAALRAGGVVETAEESETADAAVGDDAMAEDRQQDVAGAAPEADDVEDKPKAKSKTKRVKKPVAVAESGVEETTEAAADQEEAAAPTEETEETAEGSDEPHADDEVAGDVGGERS
jgi:predicted RNA-binding protein with RPS1 domain